MRKYYLDNVRGGIILLVMFYHIFYIFNSVGAISNIPIQGIPQLDVVLYILYPWFMAALFLIAGMSARYALQKRTGKVFFKERVKRLLVPSLGVMMILGWTSGYITCQYVDMFGGKGDSIPGIIKYLIYALNGIGPLWFAHELFLASMVLLLLRVIDKKDKIWQLGEKVNGTLIVLLFFAVWGAAQILNTPVITVYRHGIYIFMFLLGYYIFSHDRVQAILEKWHLPLLIIAICCGIAYTVYYYGKNYADLKYLKSLLTNLYLWFMTLAVLGCGKAWFNKETRFTKYMTPRTFGFYVLHNPIMLLIAYAVVTYMKLPMFMNYILIGVLEFILVPCILEVVRHIPGLRFWLLGISKKKADNVC